ncbi:MAG TPA: nuclear transport factor 2 family protein [Longimicrobium sp.]
MIRILLLLAVASAAAACRPFAPSVVPPPSPETAAVIEVTNRLFAAMEARDTAAIRALFLRSATIVAVGRQNGAAVVRERGVGEFLPGIVSAPAPLVERMWNPEVRIEGDLATLRARYEFHRGTELSHCGVDAFQLVRVDGAWRIAALSYTVQTEDCPPAPPR